MTEALDGAGDMHEHHRIKSHQKDFRYSNLAPINWISSTISVVPSSLGIRGVVLDTQDAVRQGVGHSLLTSV
jgi:hypothetical protein